MNELLCTVGIICQLANPRPMCPKFRTQPEVEERVNCVLPEDFQQYQQRNEGVINQPNVCDSLPPSFDLKNEQQRQLWTSFKCPLG